MPANFDAGFSVREKMWHGLGEVLADYPGRDEAVRIAGHDWTLDRRPVAVLPSGSDLGETESGDRIARGPVAILDGWDALVRSDTDDVLHVARGSYEVVQNATMWDVLDALVDDPRVRYETAGTLRGGRLVWAMARVDGEWVVKGDTSPVVPFLTVVNYHDGSGAFRAMRNGVRVVCQNTVDMALAEAAGLGSLWTFRHSANVLDRIDEARAAIDGIVAAADAFVALGNELARQRIKPEGRALFLERFIPSPEAALVTERAAANIAEAREAVAAILDGETGTVTAKQGRTAYGLFEAGVEYLDHIRPARDAESRFGRAIIKPSRRKAHVLDLAREAARV